MINYLHPVGKKYNSQIYLWQASAINLTDSFSKPSDKAKIGFHAKKCSFVKDQLLPKWKMVVQTPVFTKMVLLTSDYTNDNVTRKEKWIQENLIFTVITDMRSDMYKYTRIFTKLLKHDFRRTYLKRRAKPLEHSYSSGKSGRASAFGKGSPPRLEWFGQRFRVGFWKWTSARGNRAALPRLRTDRLHGCWKSGIASAPFSDRLPGGRWIGQGFRVGFWMAPWTEVLRV